MLIPLDGSDAALHAVDHVIETAKFYQGGVEVHLLNVQFPILSGNVRTFVSADKIEEYYREEGMKALKDARQRLDAACIAFHVHIGVGSVAETILRYAKETGCDQICMARHGIGKVALLGSVAGKLLHASEIPVLFVR